MTLYTEADSAGFAGQVVANVWAADNAWKIEAQFDGGEKLPMERFTAYDPGAQKMYADREKLDHSYVYPTPSDHFFRIVIPEGAKQVTVTATDRFGRSYQETLNL